MAFHTKKELKLGLLGSKKTVAMVVGLKMAPVSSGDVRFSEPAMALDTKYAFTNCSLLGLETIFRKCCRR